MNKVVLTGPESTGKTTLASQLSKRFECSIVKEYARSYIQKLDRPYNEDDLVEIAKGQVELEDNLLSSNKVICDTDLLTIKIWSEYKYGNCDHWIIENLKSRLPNLYLLCYPDLKWEPDPLRENPNDLLELFDIYLKEIKMLNVPHYIIRGIGKARVTSCEKVLASINF